MRGHAQLYILYDAVDLATAYDERCSVTSVVVCRYPSVDCGLLSVLGQWAETVCLESATACVGSVMLFSRFIPLRKRTKSQMSLTDFKLSSTRSEMPFTLSMKVAIALSARLLIAPSRRRGGVQRSTSTLGLASTDRVRLR